MTFDPALHPPSPVAAVHLAVFGGMRMFRGDAQIDIGPPRQRTVLAMLIAARGEVVALGALTDALWPDDPPASAANQIHRHVGEIRRMLEPGLAPRAAGQHLLPSGTGYRLELTGLSVDLADFYAARDLSPTDRLRLATHAAFSEFPIELRSLPSFAAIDRDRWSAASQVMAQALDRADADADEALSLVERVVAEAPLDEPLQADLIHYLVRIGRRARALELFEQTRARLAEELGIDPGPQLLAAHLAAVRGATSDDPALDPSVPHSIPRAVTSFVERTEARALLNEVTESTLDGRGAIALLSGMGGVGKTTLAVQWAHTVQSKFPDGALYVNMRGYDERQDVLPVETAIDRLLEQLGADVPAESAADRLAHYRTLMSGSRRILLIDNVRDADHVRPLLSGAELCLAIVTSRDQLANLVVRDGARPIPLPRWNPDESRQLLIGRLGLLRVEASPVAVDSIINSCAGLPLALAIAAARSSLEPTTSMGELAGQLADRAHTLDSLSASVDDDVRSTFEWSYRAFSPEVARMFRHLAIHPGPTMSVLSLATCADRSPVEALALVHDLVAANMAIAVDESRVELHDLLRAYADELVDEAGERGEADVRLVRHFVRSTREAFLQFGRPPTVELDLPGSEPPSIERFDRIQDSLDWYARERSILHSTIRRAFDAGLYREAALISLDWRPMNQALDTASSSIEICTVALDAARATGDGILIGDLARDVGVRLSRLGQFDAAKILLLEALDRFDSADSDEGRANTLRNLTQVCGWAGDGEAADRYAALAVDAARASGDDVTLALSLEQFAFSLPLEDEADRRGHALREALTLFESHGVDYMVGQVGSTLAHHAAQRGDMVEARELARRGMQQTEGNHPVNVWQCAVVLARAGAYFDDADEVRKALAACEEIESLLGVSLQEHFTPEDLDAESGQLVTARQWLAARDAVNSDSATEKLG